MADQQIAAYKAHITMLLQKRAQTADPNAINDIDEKIARYRSWIADPATAPLMGQGRTTADASRDTTEMASIDPGPAATSQPIREATAEAMEDFARKLAAEVDEAVRAGDETIYSEVEFTRIVLERLAEVGAVENPIVLFQEGHFGRTRYKINGFAMPDDAERLLLVAAVYTGDVPPRPATRNELVSACEQALRFYKCSCEGLHETIEPSNTDASDLARRISESQERINVLRVLLISDALTGLKSIDLKEASDGTRIVVDMYGIERLHRTLGEGLSRDDIALDFTAEMGAPLPCLSASGPGADYEAYLAAVPGRILADVYEKYGTRLLELNVRAFLGLRGRKSVNAGLRGTIRDLPHRFLAYNNGIVATVDSLDVIKTAGGGLGIASVRGLQIVNGGQTTASLHRARRQDRAPLDAIAVPVKIIRVGQNLDEMVAAVSRSANSQNTVQPADFSANEPFHVAIEKLANNTWLPDGSGRWFYERARGSYGASEAKAATSAAQKRRFAAETPKDRRFSKTDLAKYLNAWNGQPHLVSFGNQKNFQFLMQGLKDEHPDGFEPDAEWFRALVAKAIVFRTAQKVVKAAKFPAYQANIAAYLVAALSWRTGGRLDFDFVWQAQAVSPQLATMFASWTHIIEAGLRRTAGGRMPSEWAKKVDCRDAMRDIDLALPEPMPPELTAQIASGATPLGKASTRNEGLTREDMDLIDQCRGVDAETWFRVAQWGKKSGQIHWKLVGIAKTMGEYAIGGWERSPSAKQAKWAMEAHRLARIGFGQAEEPDAG